jgi:hypothetical protein
MTLRLNRNDPCPLHFIEVQGIFPSSLSHMEFQNLSISRLTSHQHQNPVLASVETVYLALFESDTLSFN